MFLLKWSVLVLTAIVVQMKAAKILAVYPAPSISHQVVFRPITLELIKRGHEVTVLTPDPMFPNGNAPKNLTEIDVHDISYSIVEKDFPTVVAGKKSDLIIQSKFLMRTFPMIFEEQMKKAKDIILNQTEGYDLILLEALFVPALAMSHKYNAPTILISSLGSPPDINEMMGIPAHPILYPTIARQRIYNLTLWEKFTEIYTQIQMLNHHLSLDEQTNNMIKKIFGNDSPSTKDLGKYIDMLFLNIHPIWEGNFPVPPNVIYMGGLHQKPPKPLPQELQQYLDASDMGVIYVSFGTNVKPSLLPPEKMEIFENVFSLLPFNVIWKWDNENFEPKSSNVKILKWVPQPDLLRHPNVKAFITQGGLQSTDEAITAEVPLIGVPMLGDQWYNVEKYVYHSIGVALDFEYITEDQLKNAIIEVVENKSYKRNIARLHALMSDQPQPPLDRAIWWIEYVLRHGGAKHLRAPGADTSWTEFFMLDVLGIVLSVVFITIVLTYVLIKLTFSKLFKIFCHEKLKQI